ncbi:MAG TPA: bifunctional glutamate N-acetyltransferase/amino-acid acetyltransferase ArgJ, partial [Thermoanaerobaculia bacterium]|nr:bifunctional glutamate N-acetyltransferase/amino-acid acetyltransferase ArgJ [Thermoanaerobaculia bacterium]
MKLPKGFLASGVRAGIRKKRPDLGIIVAPDGATAAAVFTQNKFQAAPVVLSKASLKKSGGRVRAVVVNAGCANAVTGKEGLDAAKRVRVRAAELVRCEEDEVFLASTGVIGVVLPDKKVRDFLPDAISRLSTGGVDALSHAILTTDVGPKVAQATFTLGGKRGRLVGVAKGAGMIHPNMATMLAFVMTDANVDAATLQRCLKSAVDQSFNSISVDGDTSTNDTVLVMASGKLGNATRDDLTDFQRALDAICRDLAWRIVRDGEGATRVMELEVTGAKSDRDAKLAAHAIATSPLVKTALHGGDPNWGRILAAVGRSGARFSLKKISLSAGSVKLVVDGAPA